MTKRVPANPPARSILPAFPVSPIVWQQLSTSERWHVRSAWSALFASWCWILLRLAGVAFRDRVSPSGQHSSGLAAFDEGFEVLAGSGSGVAPLRDDLPLCRLSAYGSRFRPPALVVSHQRTARRHSGSATDLRCGAGRCVLASLGERSSSPCAPNALFHFPNRCSAVVVHAAHGRSRPRWQDTRSCSGVVGGPQLGVCAVSAAGLSVSVGWVPARTPGSWWRLPPDLPLRVPGLFIRLVRLASLGSSIARTVHLLVMVSVRPGVVSPRPFC